MIDLTEGILREFAERAAMRDDELSDFVGLHIFQPRRPPRSHLPAEELAAVRQSAAEYMRDYRRRNGTPPKSEARKAADREYRRRVRAKQEGCVDVLPQRHIVSGLAAAQLHTLPSLHGQRERIEGLPDH